MKFGILVNEGPYQHQASDTAYQFTKAALAQGHEIFRVFFYHDGVYNATSISAPPQDDRNVAQQWADLAEEHNLDLVVCVAAALRRGILDEEQAQKSSNTTYNLETKEGNGFRISGLGQLLEAGIQADRLVTFGD